MTKTFYFFVVLFCISSGNLFAQEEADSTATKRKHKYRHWRMRENRDTLDARQQITKKAEDVLVTVFNPNEPTLNNADSIIQAFDDLPSFGIYKNNYIITGTTIGHEPSEYNSDAKFQISVSQRLTNSVLPFRTYLMLTYTQLAFWNIYQESFPFGDINFNPTVGFGRALAYKNRFLGTLMFQFEHESNGKDGEDSRSWNKLSFGAMFKLNRFWTVQTKAWIPFVDGENNKDIVRYKGWGHMAVDYGNNNKYNAGLLLTKRGGGFFDNNITLNFSYRLFKRENQYLFLEYYNGYGENMLEYKRYRHMVRIGFVIQPNFFHLY